MPCPDAASHSVSRISYTLASNAARNHGIDLLGLFCFLKYSEVKKMMGATSLEQLRGTLCSYDLTIGMVAQWRLGSIEFQRLRMGGVSEMQAMWAELEGLARPLDPANPRDKFIADLMQTSFIVYMAAARSNGQKVSAVMQRDAHRNARRFAERAAIGMKFT